MSLDSDSLPLHKYLKPHKEILRRHKAHWTDSYPRFATILSVIMFFASVTVNYFAEIYATESASNPVTDIILSNTRVFDVDAIFVYGAVALIVFNIALLFLNPKRIPFTLHSFTLFYLTRAMFITLTHIGPFPVHAVFDFGSVITRVIFGGGLFFSAHTGAPFLMALLFWKDKILRYIFIAWSVLFAVTVLLGHLHYTIDVVSAYFITYTIFHIAELIFKKDRELFHREPDAVIAVPQT